MKKTLQEVREYINEGVYDPGIFKAFFLAGGPGSGKTFVTKQVCFRFKIVNSDIQFEKFKKSKLSLKCQMKKNTLEYIRTGKSKGICR